MGLGTTGQSITLANSIIGVGILAMPFCFQQCGVLLATLILLLMGLVSRLSCYFLLKSALLTKRRNFEFLAFHVFGSMGKVAVEVGIIGFLMGTCIAYFVVVGDLGPQIIAKLFNINQSDILRTSIMLIVSLVCVLPLGLLRNVDSLSNVSAATICFYFCLVMKVITEAASQLLSNDWHTKVELWKPSGVLQCVPIFSMALFCQAQLFEIFESLPSFSIEKMNVVTKNAINICTSVYFTLGLFGYIAFCSQEISGNILMSLSPTLASDVIKLGFVLSLAFSFPLIIFPCRASLYSFLYKKVHSHHHDHIASHSIPAGAFRCITVGIVAAALCAGVLLPHVELVLGLLGSTVGVVICVLFPAACFVRVTYKDTNERLLAKCLLVLGLGILILGTYANLQAAEKTVDRFDESRITQERIDKIVEDFFESKKINSEGTIIKPVLRNDYNVQSDDNIVKNSEILKDSEIQPPNPVPPESMSNEKVAARIEPLENKKLNEVLPDDKQNVIDAEDKSSETHPKNLKSKLSEAKSSKELNNDNNSNKDDEKRKDEPKPQSNHDKNDLLKQEQLIETIKQHGEEQKELIKEQKEILKKIIKAKQEIQQNKKEINSDEAKKIAVESIQHIADVAIRSLSGVTDKPNAPIQSEPLEKTANKVVEEIEKKAIKTIETIEELKRKTKEPIDTQNSHMGVEQPKNTLVDKKQDDVEKVNVQQVAILNNQGNLKTPTETENKPAKNTIGLRNPKPVVNNDQGKNNEPLKNQVKYETQPIDLNVKNKLDEHSHSPDEPQSYKQGEDTQKDNKLQLTNNIAHNMPIPLVINGNSNLNNIVKQHANKKSEASKVKLMNNIKDTLRNTKIMQENLDENMKNNNNNGAQNNNLLNNVKINKESGLNRQKREVVDCTEKATLKPEDREICKSLLSNDMSNEILPMKVDLNDGLQRKLPLDTIHHVRSLKSYDETKQKR